MGNPIFHKTVDLTINLINKTHYLYRIITPFFGKIRRCPCVGVLLNNGKIINYFESNNYFSYIIRIYLINKIHKLFIILYYVKGGNIDFSII
jgi:hypothetical protein